MNNSKKQKRVTWGNNTIISYKSPLYTYPKATETNQAQMEITLGRYEPLMIEKDMEENKEPYTNIKSNRTTKGKRTRIRKNKNLTIAVININGAKGKMKSLESLLEAEKIQIALITETKLREKQKINIKGYKWIGKNRKQKDGGGVGILIAKNIEKHVLEDNTGEEYEDLESKWIKLESRPKNISIGVFYGPQENEKVEKTKEIFEKLENQITQKLTENELIIGGDFNAKLEIIKPTEKQEQSRNGKILQDLITKKDLDPISIKADIGTWTRFEWNNKEKKSTVDYIITTKRIAKNTTHTIVDEKGNKKIYGNNKKETDHNTIITNIKINNPRKKTYINKWRINNKEGWNEFNTRIQERNKKREIRTLEYEEAEKVIKRTLEQTIGKVKIRTDKTRKPQSEEIKATKKERKEAKKLFEQACKSGTKAQKASMLEKYIETQKRTREMIDKYETEQTEKRILELINKTKIDPNSIWQARRAARSNNELEYNTITEEGKELTDPEETKEHIAKYFENLYQARPGTTEYQASTEMITKTMKEFQEKYRKPGTEHEPITNKEIDAAIKKLKRKKSLGPDQLPNEIFIEADQETRNILCDIIREVHTKEKIPHRWLEGEIKRLYKGKGVKGKCSNERGITLASNFGKVYERILNERVKKEVYITKAQGGGITGNATVDHLIVLKEAIRQIRKRGKTAYVVFLDVQKAYDKAWLDAILFTMKKNGITDKNLEMMRKMNTGLTARIRTKHGLTRKINIKDSIRQGGVLSVIEYATLMDEITKEIQKRKQGIKMDNGETLANLLWMDDVALIHENLKELQEVMNTTNHVALTNHIEFGAAKCKVVKNGPGKKSHISLNGQILEEVTAYKYLGDMINNKGDLEDQIIALKGKIHAATQEILAETGNKEFKGMKMAAIWELVETIIIPIITYGSESWEPKKKEIAQIETIFNKALKTILQLPDQTPTAILLAETGFLTIEMNVNKKKIMHANRVLTKEEPGLIQQLTQGNSIWREGIRKLQEDYSITDETLQGNKETLKKIVYSENRSKFEKYIIKEAEEKSKVKHWLEMREGEIPQRRANYLKTMTRKQCTSIIKVRTRMVPVKANYGDRYQDKICRLCQEEEETQKHVLSECRITKIEARHFEYTKYFTEDEEKTLKIMAENNLKIVELMENI